MTLWVTRIGGLVLFVVLALVIGQLVSRFHLEVYCVYLYIIGVLSSVVLVLTGEIWKI